MKLRIGLVERIFRGSHLEMANAVLSEKIRRFFDAGHSNVACVYLFGSEARGDAGALSDVLMR